MRDGLTRLAAGGRFGRLAAATLAVTMPMTGVQARQADGRYRVDVVRCGCPVPVRAVPANAVPGRSDVQRVEAVALAQRLCTDIASLPKGASTDDLEAAAVYAISQSRASDDAARIAISSMLGCNQGSHNLRAALSRVLAALHGKRLNRGTALLAGGGFGTSFFSSPSVNIGGGTSNYSR